MSGVPNRDDKEEQYILRVQDKALADKIREVLKRKPEENSGQDKWELKFDSDPRKGLFVFNGQSYPVSLLDLPTVVESYKTYDDVNLVKSTDVGQMLVVQEMSSAPLDGPESRHGVTPPMRDARQRHFRHTADANPRIVEDVERDLLTIVAGEAPPGYQYVDIEEEYKVDSTGKGSWVPVQRKK